MAPNKDSGLKRQVCEVLENCDLKDVLLDREVHLNLDGETDNEGNLQSQKEIDVIARFKYAGKRIAFFFECEDSTTSKNVRAHYKGYAAHVKEILQGKAAVRVVHSADNVINSRHFRDIDEIHVCFVFGSRFPHSKYLSQTAEARKYQFLVWNFTALQYYRRISSTLGAWTKYELFKDFSVNLESTSTYDIPALQLAQKGHTMFLANIHPGLLLKIGYVVRRATEKTYAYQRMLNGDRIKAIAEFISSQDDRNFLPNAVLAVFDSDQQTQASLRYNAETKMLTIPVRYCSAWIIDGQHRAFGFLGTPYEDWDREEFEPFDLPIVIFKQLAEPIQTETFININYNQKRIKSDLLCDLVTLTKDLQHRLTWASLMGHELNESTKSPLKDRIRISELHRGRPIGLTSLVQYGLLETLLGYKQKTGGYSGVLYNFSPFDRSQKFDSPHNQSAFKAQAGLLIRFLVGVEKNTKVADAATDPWTQTSQFALLRPTGLNACFLLLARILERHGDAGLDFNVYLKPLKSVNFRRNYVANLGGGWKGFRRLANNMLRKMNKTLPRSRRLRLYGQKEKI